jgi:acetyl-CoA carboxylase biotin carboxyl carrier protein
MIDIRKLKELVRLMVDNDLTELDLRDSEEQVTMRRSHPQAAPTIVHPPAAMMHVPVGGMTVAPATGQLPAPIVPGAVAAGGDEAGLLRIESPMVGTFYAAANPDSPPFASIGAAITPDKTVCIIEAMKIFNEIKAECSGTIARVLVKNGEPVEFGQTLFLVKPG